MKNAFSLLFVGCAIMLFSLALGICGVTVFRLFMSSNSVTPSQWTQTLETLERSSNGKTSCDVKWEDKKMTLTFHFNDITNSFFRN